MGEDIQLIIISPIWKSLIYSQSRQVISMMWKDRWASHADKVDPKGSALTFSWKCYNTAVQLQAQL